MSSDEIKEERRQPETEAFVPDIARQPEEDPSYEPSAHGPAKKKWKIPTLGWFVLAGIVICALGTGLKLILHQTPEHQQEIEGKGGVAGEGEVGELLQHSIDLKDEESKRFSQTSQRMRDAVKNFILADSIEAMLAHVRHPQRVKPLMEKYYQSHEMVTNQFRHVEIYQPLSIEGLPFMSGWVELKDGIKRDILLECMPDGSFKVDWESYVCYMPMDWDHFIASRPAQPLVMRVRVQPDHFYAYEFRDDQLFDCYMLKARGSDQHLFGYVRKGSEVSIAMRRFFMQIRSSGSTKMEPLTLLLRFPENSRSKRSVYIDHMLAPRWVFAHVSDAALD